MIDIVILGVLILIGVTLILAEVIFIPGTTLVGLLGFGCLVVGVYFSYDYYGETTGNMVFISSAVFLVISILYTLKAKTWKKLGLETSIDSKVNENIEIGVYKGCIAIAVSDMRPFGTIEFENEQYEAESLSGFVSRKESVEVVNVKGNHIFVEKVIK